MATLSQKKTASRDRRHRRVRAKVKGTAQRPRLNVYRSLENIFAQVIDDVDGKTLASASTIDKEVAKQISDKNKVDSAKVSPKFWPNARRVPGLQESWLRMQESLDLWELHRAKASEYAGIESLAP